jgi:hypothetical protein
MIEPHHLELPADHPLRQKLWQITDDPTRYGAGAQPDGVESLREQYPHSIKCLQPRFGYQRRTWDFNCHAFSLGLSSADEFWALRPQEDKLLPESDFVEELIQAGSLTARTQANFREGDVLVYYFESQIVHSGILVGELVHSKWGNGHLWEHKTPEVPAAYGEHVAAFELPCSEEILPRFREYIERRLTRRCS